MLYIKHINLALSINLAQQHLPQIFIRKKKTFYAKLQPSSRMNNSLKSEKLQIIKLSLFISRRQEQDLNSSESMLLPYSYMFPS